MPTTTSLQSRWLSLALAWMTVSTPMPSLSMDKTTVIPIPSFVRRSRHPATSYRCQRVNTSKYAFFISQFYLSLSFISPQLYLMTMAMAPIPGSSQQRGQQSPPLAAFPNDDSSPPPVQRCDSGHSQLSKCPKHGHPARNRAATQVGQKH